MYGLLFFVGLFFSANCFSIGSNFNSSVVTGTQNQGPCGNPDDSNFHWFNIPATNLEGKDISSLLIVYDALQQTTVCSTAYYDADNKHIGSLRKDMWRELGCPNEYPCNDVYENTDYARGHLTPVCDLRFSESAMLSTSFCVNQAPQVHNGFNNGPWRSVEWEISNLAKQYGGMVMTGVCQYDMETQEYFVPECFWKMYCFKSSVEDPALVYGYVGDNKSQTGYLPRYSQQIVRSLIGEQYGGIVNYIWPRAYTSLRYNRKSPPNMPTGAECAAALRLSQEQNQKIDKLIAKLDRNNTGSGVERQCSDDCFCADEL